MGMGLLLATIATSGVLRGSADASTIPIDLRHLPEPPRREELVLQLPRYAIPPERDPRLLTPGSVARKCEFICSARNGGGVDICFEIPAQHSIALLIAKAMENWPKSNAGEPMALCASDIKVSFLHILNAAGWQRPCRQKRSCKFTLKSGHAGVFQEAREASRVDHSRSTAGRFQPIPGQTRIEHVRFADILLALVLRLDESSQLWAANPLETQTLRFLESGAHGLLAWGGPNKGYAFTLQKKD